MDSPVHRLGVCALNRTSSSSGVGLLGRRAGPPRTRRRRAVPSPPRFRHGRDSCHIPCAQRCFTQRDHLARRTPSSSMHGSKVARSISGSWRTSDRNGTKAIGSDGPSPCGSNRIIFPGASGPLHVADRARAWRRSYSGSKGMTWISTLPSGKSRLKTIRSPSEESI